MAKDVVRGGAMYFSQIFLPSLRMAVSKALPALMRSAPGLVGGFEALPGFARKLGVDGKQRFAVGRGQLDDELDDLVGAGLGLRVLLELAGREHLLEQRLEHDFADGAAGFDVGEDAREIVDAGGKLGHLAQPGVDLGELVGDLAKALGQARLQRGVELFVDRNAHLLELGGVGQVELVEAVLDGLAQGFEVLALAGAQFVEAGVQGFAAFGGLACGGGAGRLRAWSAACCRACRCWSGLRCAASALEDGRVGAQLREFGAEVLVEPLGAGIQARELAGQIGGKQLGEARIFDRAERQRYCGAAAAQSGPRASRVGGR